MRVGLPKSDLMARLDEFERLTKSTEPTLFRVAYRLTGNLDDAKDLLQDALIEAFKAFDKFRPDGYFDRWLIRIMTNTFIDSCRRKAVRPQSVRLSDLIKSDDSMVEGDLPDMDHNPEDAALSSEFRTVLDNALSRIPEEYRTALILCDMEGFSYAEAAQAMGCPEGTVRSRLHRARHAVRRLMEPYLKSDQDETYRISDLLFGSMTGWSART